jgi:hypothetical protein
VNVSSYPCINVCLCVYLFVFFCQLIDVDHPNATYSLSFYISPFFRCQHVTRKRPDISNRSPSLYLPHVLYAAASVNRRILFCIYYTAQLTVFIYYIDTMLFEENQVLPDSPDASPATPSSASLRASPLTVPSSDMYVPSNDNDINFCVLSE